MPLPRALAALAVAMMLSLPLAAADNSSSAELVQKARAILEAGGNSREAAVKATPLLWQAIEADQRNGPALVLLWFVLDKTGDQGNSQRYYFTATRAGGIDEPWLVPYHLAYAEKYDESKLAHYRELYAKAPPSDADPAKLFDRHHKIYQEAMAHRDRTKLDAEVAEMLRLKPGEAFIYGDTSRGLMTNFLDFDAGETYARKALSMRDYAHARQSLSLALYGKWAVAVKEGRDPAQVRALLAAAQANDPTARNVPTCALEYPPLRFVADGLQGLYRKNYRDPTLQNC